MPDKETIERLRRLIRDLEKRHGNFAAYGPYEVRDWGANEQGEITPVKEEEQVFDGFSVSRAFYEVNPQELLVKVPSWSLEGLRSLDMRLSTVENWLYLDIETTGLLGAGTVAFLIGTGQWLDDVFLVTQYFLRRREAEEEMLCLLEKSISSADCLVTFNGRTFDVPLLSGRYVISGLRPPIVPSHLDLLSFARCVGKMHDGTASLQDCVERHVGRKRTGDIPGNMIPALYFIYEREGDQGVLSPVFLHNRLDIVDMVSLATAFAHFLSGDDKLADLIELQAAGTFHYRRRNFELARFCLEKSVGRLDGVKDNRDASGLRLLCTLLRRRGEWEKAAEIWRNIIDSGFGILDDYLWLTRYYEKSHDLKNCRVTLNKALKKFCDSWGQGPNRLMSRKRRLQKAGLL